MLEVQALTNVPQRGVGRSLMLNAHGIMWTNDPCFDVAAVESALCVSQRLISGSGAPTVKISPVATIADLTRSLGYTLKVPFKASAPCGLMSTGDCGRL